MYSVYKLLEFFPFSSEKVLPLLVVFGVEDLLLGLLRRSDREGDHLANVAKHLLHPVKFLLVGNDRSKSRPDVLKARLHGLDLSFQLLNPLLVLHCVRCCELLCTPIILE